MPSNTVELAWALPVKVDTLGAHLQAYITLRPALDMLRLCNRFGRVSGGKGITSLPVELVEHVEKHLLEDERAKERGLWEEDFKCWEDRCEVMDHFNPAQVHVIYHDIHDHYCECSCRDEEDFISDDEESFARLKAFEVQNLKCAESSGTFKHSRKHIAQQKKEVESYVHCLASEGENDIWRDECMSRQDSWEERVGDCATPKDRGRLGRMSSVLEKDFGLRIWVGHEHCVERSSWGDSVGRTTSTHLQIPNLNSSANHQWEPYTVWETRQSTAFSFTHPAVVPPAPTTSSLARFDRTIKALRLEVVQRKQDPWAEGSSEKPGSQKRQDDGKKCKEGDDEKTTDNISTVPQLTMFSIIKDETDDSY